MKVEPGFGARRRTAVSPGDILRTGASPGRTAMAFPTPGQAIGGVPYVRIFLRRR